jgi:GNAT superfamily N-acetyltransferase
VSEPRPGVAGVEDAGQAAALLDAFNREFDDPTPGVEALTRRVRELIQEDTGTFLLTDELAVALLRFRPSVWTRGLVAYLEELYVVPDARGRGHGRALLEAAISYARTRGATSMEIAVDEPDAPAIRLYESAGFSCQVEPGSEAIMRFYEREFE